MTYFFLIAAGLVAGFIDSIAGGGGLITVPSLMLVVGTGAHAIGSNKVAGVAAAGMALIVYRRVQKVSWLAMLGYTAWVALGSFCGSRVSPYFPPEAFRWFLIFTCPLILWVVWNKKFWLKIAGPTDASIQPAGAKWKIALAGFACGFYDGVWGPGGGTFMLLSLLFIAHQPLMVALVTSKFANTASAAASLGGYAMQDLVHWWPGLAIGAGCATGALIGARYASERTAKVLRPTLVVVVALLVLRLWFSTG